MKTPTWLYKIPFRLGLRKLKTDSGCIVVRAGEKIEAGDIVHFEHGVAYKVPTVIAGQAGSVLYIDEDGTGWPILPPTKNSEP